MLILITIMTVIIFVIARQVKLIDYVTMIMSIKEEEKKVYDNIDYARYSMRLFNNIYSKTIGYRKPVLYENPTHDKWAIRFEEA